MFLGISWSHCGLQFIRVTRLKVLTVHSLNRRVERRIVVRKSSISAVEGKDAYDSDSPPFPLHYLSLKWLEVEKSVLREDLSFKNGECT